MSETLEHRLIHRDRDEEGILEVIDDDITRTLYFGSRAKQSSMLLAHPTILVLTYTQAMLAALLFQPAPRSALVIGLGGGSLPKFLHHHFPDCQVRAVECRPKVVELAYDYFALPRDERMRVFTGRGLNYLTEQEPDLKFDLIFLDAYDAQGMGPELSEDDFFRRCRERLTPEGVLSANLWATRKSVCEQHMKAMRRAFAGQLLSLPAKNCGNLIGIAPNRSFPARRLPQLKKQAEQAYQRYGIDFPEMLDRMHGRHRSLLRRLFG